MFLCNKLTEYLPERQHRAGISQPSAALKAICNFVIIRLVNTFETAITERYLRRESGVEEALIEMYLAGVSVRRVEDITEALWGSKVSLHHQ